MAAVANTVDSMVKEYLIFRGFTATLKAFENEIKTDKDKSFKVEKIVEQINAYLLAYDINSLHGYWSYLDKRFFSQLSHEAYKKVKKVETSLLRLYVVHAIQNSKQDKLVEFFEKYSSQLQGVPMWRDWFAIPFLKNVDQIPMFSVYFTRLWQESVVVAIYNCLDTIFSHMSLPTLLSFERERDLVNRLESQTRSCQDQIAMLQQELIKIKSLKKSGCKNVACQTGSSNQPPVTTEAPTPTKPSLFQSVTAPLGFKKGKMRWRVGGSRDTKLAKQNQPMTLLEKQETGPLVKENNWDTYPDEQEMDNVISRDTSSVPASEEPNRRSLTPPSTNHHNASTVRPHSYADTSTFYLELNSQSSGLSNRLEMVENAAAGSTNRASSPNELDKPFIILSQDEFMEHSSAVAACKFSQSGSSLASLDIDGAVRVWQCYPTVSCYASISSKSPVLSFDWIPKHDNHILLGRASGKVQLYDAASRRTILDAHVDSEFPRVSTIALNPNGSSFVVSVAEAKQLKRATSFSVRTPRTERKATKMKSLTDPSDDCRGGTLLAWDLKTFKQESELVLDPFPVSITCMSYNHNGTLLVSGGADGLIRLFDTRTYDCLVGWHAHSAPVLDVQFSVDETIIFSVGADYKMVLWDVHKVSVKLIEYHLPHIGIHSFMNKDAGSSFLHHANDYVPCGKLFSFDSDGQYLMGCESDYLSISKVSPAEPLHHVMRIHGHRSPLCCLDWTSSPNCSLCVSGFKSGIIQFSTLLKQ